jgi:gliding motility-associated-like protein
VPLYATIKPAKKRQPSFLWMVVLLLMPLFSALAQLPAFTLNVTKTDETCIGNGTLTFSTTGNDPSATMTYTVYELPNTTSPITVQTTTSISGLTEGDYQVVATQSLGADSNSQTQQIHIDDQLITLAYTISSTEVTCNNNATMTASVFSGTGVSYEIISGPMIRPQQTSNVFTGLAAGVYEVRVFDNCGEGWVATHTIFYDNSFSVTQTTPQDQELVSCNSTTFSQTINAPAGANITYPLTVVYTFYPPGGGAPQVITSTINAGDPQSIVIDTVVPYYDDQTYTYTVVITDGCNKEYNSGNTQIHPRFSATVSKVPGDCGKYSLDYSFANYMPPLTFNFLAVPTGFNPIDFNTNHPGPYTSSPVSYGDPTNPVPFGIYRAEITDGCGRTVITNINVEEIEPEPNINISPNPGCDDRSKVEIKIPPNIEIVNATITTAPTTFTTPLPADMSSMINGQGALIMENMPPGVYTITLLDECGDTYTVPFTVVASISQATVSERPACDLGMGSVRVRAACTNLVSAIITAAPSEFSQTLPYDASFNITAGGIFSMSGLPEGNYTFQVTDNLNVQMTRSIFVNAYEVTENTFSIVEHCGSFDLTFAHDTNATTALLFFLQRFNPATGTWGHPQTNVPYTDGDLISNTTALAITNDTTTFSITYLGDFRIIKQYETYDNGSVGEFKICHEVIQSFTFTNTIRITDIQKNTCSGQTSDVTVTALGVDPLTYQITSKNGLPFFIDNGHNNVFHNLTPAIYNFLVFDPCNNVGNRIVDVAALPSLVNINQPPDMKDCDGDDHDGKATFNLSDQDAIILGSQSAALYTVTYHTNPADAAGDINPLPVMHTSGSETIYIRLEYNGVAGCYDVGSFDLVVAPTPELHVDPTEVICEGNSITLTADAGFPSYLWSSGETTQSIVVDTPGTYTVEVSQTQNGVTCSTTASIDVKLSASATIRQLLTTDFTSDENTITVILENPGVGFYSYSLDNQHFQSSNTFVGLPAGEYTVYVRDENGCDPIEQEVYLLTYPKFFTPNGDGYNDFWQVKFSYNEPTMKVYIFDRYGKLLTGFNGASVGWDGRYNNADLPSEDYWFLVIRPNGKEYRGHFAMKR